MSLDSIIRGVTSGTGADVDADKQLLVKTNTDASKAGASVMFFENDDGTLTGSRYLKSGEVSPDWRVRTGTDSVLFTDNFNATTQNTNLWAYTFATATTHAPRRVQLGFQSAAVGTAIGGLYSPEVTFDFDSPIVVRPGEYIATVMKIVVGTATPSQTITYNVTFDGNFE